MAVSTFLGMPVRTVKELERVKGGERGGAAVRFQTLVKWEKPGSELHTLLEYTTQVEIAVQERCQSRHIKQ
jgi:hypothetical protein